MFRTVGFSLALVMGVSIALWYSVVHLVYIIVERVI